MIRLACQEHLLPGDGAEEKWASAERCGYQGIELRGGGDDAFRARLPELKAAVKSGARYPSICGILPGVYVGSFEKAERQDAIARLKVLLSAAAELGGAGVIAPAAYGIHSAALPPRRRWRSAEDDHAVLVEGFGALGEHAAREGVKLYLEPLNRYEDNMMNRLEQAAALCEEIGLASLAIMADLFHMSIEEADMAASLVAARSRLAHLHGADSNRFEPGAGHTDFAAIRKALDGIGFDGFIALECRLSGDPEQALRRAVKVLATP